jgi:hypothetical protein
LLIFPTPVRTHNTAAFSGRQTRKIDALPNAEQRLSAGNDQRNAVSHDGRLEMRRAVAFGMAKLRTVGIRFVERKR